MSDTKDIELKKISKEVMHLSSEAPAKIATPEEYDQAAKWLVPVKLKLREWEERIERIAKPLREALNELRRHKDDVLTPVAEQVRRIETGMASFIHVQEQQAAFVNQGKMERYESKVATAVAKGKSAESVPLPQLAAGPTVQVRSGEGELSMRHITRWRLTASKDVTSLLLLPKADGGHGLRIFRTDPRFADLPDSCWELNPSQVLAAAKIGHPAVELFTVPVPVVKAAGASRNGQER